MAQNKNALIRYKTIDHCLQNRDRTWTLDDLILECSKVLSEKEGRDVVISKRSIQLDIQMMRSSDGGYNAPIAVYQRKFYHYSDEDFSITNLSLTENDKELILDCLNTLDQYNGFVFYPQIQKSVDDLRRNLFTESKLESSEKSNEVEVEIDASKRGKVLKKPLHKSQKVKQEKKNGNVVLTFNIKNLSKLASKLASYKSAVKVISPKELKKELKKKSH